MDFLRRADALMPQIIKKRVYPLKESEPKDKPMRCGNGFTLDFGSHVVGYLTLNVVPDAVPDSPLEIVFRFAEMPFELDDIPYNGGLSSTWMQKETVYIDCPGTDVITLHRRYAFRYVDVRFPGNTAYSVKYVSSYCTTVSSADIGKLKPLPTDTDSLLMRIDNVAVRTLHNCMQSVFEDGPKRDRRLWLGDLYLQAKANYVTFKNNDLVLRCMYLFAGITHPDGCLSSAVFQEPLLQKSSWILHDYALFFIGVLYDYYKETKNIAIVEELWPTAFRQAEIVIESADKQGLFPVSRYFVDWCDQLDKRVAVQGIVITMLKQAIELAEELSEYDKAEKLKCSIDIFSDAALKMYDRSRCLFVAPGSMQVSKASQVWMILAGVLDNNENNKILDALKMCDEAVNTVTPYAMHYYVEALLLCGRKQEALDTIKNYWGGMVKKKADCFWEVYVPGDSEASPYNSKLANSYCHAWSCTPTYFIRKYFIEND